MLKSFKMLAPLSSIILLATCFIALTGGSFFTDLFNPGIDKAPKFSGSQLYLLDSSSLGLDEIEGYIGCFGDFNSDKSTDLFVISGTGNGTLVDVYLWNGDSWSFWNSSATVSSPNITNIAAGDFDYDGKLDLLVTGWDPTTNITYVSIFKGDLTVFSTEPISTIYSVDQVDILDANNDLKLDLYGEMLLYNSTQTQRVFWVNKGNGSFEVVHESVTPLAPLATPNANAFVDFDGDCLADRFVTSMGASGPQYELWLNGKSEGYKLHSTSALPAGAGQISFSDFDRDGNLDFLFPVCYPQPNCTQVNAIYIVFNHQKPMCALLSANSGCRTSTNLCSADPYFQLGDLGNAQSDPLVSIVPMSAFSNGHFYFDDKKGRPLNLRVGDYNLDGYPDLLVPMIGNDGTTRIELWQNTQDPNTGARTFQMLDSGVDDLVSIPDAYAATFFDLGEDGVPDIFVLADNPPRIVTIYNNFENDAFFLKTLGLNGVCPEWCPTSPKFPDPKPYGVNYVGGVFKYTYTDLSGNTILATGTQLPQSSYLALHTPYILFGLGRTSNYIEQFFYGVSLNSTNFNYWTGSTIPNSQVVAIPYEPGNPASWTLELYITPSGLLFWIMVAFLASLLILGITVYIFHRKEKREDELQKQEQAHLFSFDAL